MPRGRGGSSAWSGSNQRHNADLTAYPNGISITRTTAANGWALDGFAVTFKDNTVATTALQFANATGTITYTPTSPATSTTGLPTSVAANTAIRMIYNTGNLKWYPA